MTNPNDKAWIDGGKMPGEYELARDAAADRCAQIKKISGWGIDHLRLIEVFAEGADWGYERGKNEIPKDGLVGARNALHALDRMRESYEKQLEAANKLANQLADKSIELAQQLTAANALIEKLGAALKYAANHAGWATAQETAIKARNCAAEARETALAGLAQLEQWRKERA